MTREEIDLYLQNSDSDEFIIYGVDKDDLDALDGFPEEGLSDYDMKEIVRRAVNGFQRDLEDVVGVGSAVYDMMKERLNIVFRAYLKEKENIDKADGRIEALLCSNLPEDEV